MRGYNDDAKTRQENATIRKPDVAKHNDTTDTTTRHPTVVYIDITIQRYHFTRKTLHLIPNASNLMPEITQYRMHSALTSKPPSCTSKHNWHSHPTTLCKDYCRRAPEVPIVIVDNTTNNIPKVLFLLSAGLQSLVPFYSKLPGVAVDFFFVLLVSCS